MWLRWKKPSPKTWKPRRFRCAWALPGLSKVYPTVYGGNFETPFYLRRAIEVKFSTITAEWQISGKSSTGRHDVAAYVTYGTDRANAYKILEDTRI